MPEPPDTEHYLPTRDISYAYTVAMHFAQQLELDLRCILFTADYHGWLPDIPLIDEQRKRYKSTDAFIDKATCGLLIKALRETSTASDDRVWPVFDRACEHRNRLAHSFLSEHDFDHLSAAQEQSIIKDLIESSTFTRKALRISGSKDSFPRSRSMFIQETVARPRPNQTTQPTAGRSDAPLHFMKTRPLQATLALASGG